MLQELTEQAIFSLQQTIKFAEDNKLTNTQEFINFLDIVNELSVKY